jgi:hypothetical protein
MILIITGLVFSLIGWGNLAMSRLHPDRPNARMTRGLGYVGIICGLLTLIGGIAQVAGLEPPAVPAAQPGANR